MIQLKVKKLHPDARIPQYATDGAACFDIHALILEPNTHAQVLSSSIVSIGTGLAFEVPKGWVLKVYSRSGHGFKNGVRLANCVGVIDSDYRGELRVGLFCDLSSGLRVRNGDRIAQAMLEPAPVCQLIEVDELSETERGANGMGSTGV